MTNKIAYILLIFVAYFVFEVKHDEAVSMDSRGGTTNKEWHRWDMWFHISIAMAVGVIPGYEYGLLILTSRGLFFDTRFSKVWHGNIFYVGANEPGWKKKHIKLYRLFSVILYVINVILIIKK